MGLQRKFRVGQLVQTKSGTVCKVIGSADYGFYKGKTMKGAFTSYRIHPSGSSRTIYRRESELRPVTMGKKGRR